jgi:adenosine kinase
LRELLARATVVFADEHELALAALTSDLSAGMDVLLAQGPELIVVKRASAGALMKRRGGTTLHASAVELQRLANPTGAGDAFAGALLAALVTAPERGDEYALRFATATASFAIEAVGTGGLVHIDPRLLMHRMRSLIVSRSERSGTFA